MYFTCSRWWGPANQSNLKTTNREIILLHLTKDNQKNGNSSLSQTEQHTDHLIKADLHRRVVDNRTLKRWFSSFSIGNALHVAAIIGTPHTTLVSRVLLWLCSKSRTIKIRSQQKVYTLRMSVDVVVVLYYYLKKMIGSFQIGLNHLVIYDLRYV